MNFIFDKIIFIHCKHRLDRYQNIQNFISKFNLTNYFILEATYLPKNGAKGCSHSHYRAMEYCLENNLNNVLILEDDYFLEENPQDINSKLEKIFKIEKWDVIMFWWLLNGVDKRSIKINDDLRKITHHKYGGSSTLAYSVNKSMFKILRDLFLESFNKLDDTYNHSQKQFKTDAIWLTQQHKYNWFIINPKIGIQVDTKSDIHNW
jgi:GR25 family glycosyltransferase involved in LPS biosynthesis